MPIRARRPKLADFEWQVRGPFILVQPSQWSSPGSLGLTLTNAAESVVRWLADAHVLRDGRRVLYLDTDGQWDEMLTDGERFLDFHFLGARTAESAIEEALAHPPPERQTDDVNDADDRLADWADRHRD